MAERRLKTVRIPQSQVLEWFQCAVHGWPKSVALPIYTGLPDGCEVWSVHHDYMTRCFVFTVQHDSFDLVPDGEYIPAFTDDLRIEYGTIIDITDPDYDELQDRVPRSIRQRRTSSEGL